MKILAIEHENPLAGGDAFAPLLKDEARRTWALLQEAVLREIYFDRQKHTAILILECAGRAEAQAVLETMPLVQAGLISFEVIELAPYDGFARLFAA